MLSNPASDIHNNQELYASAEFGTWLQYEDLDPQEVFVINKYLKPDLSTIEAGTNGGRILFQLRKMGFTSLTGYDYVPELIDVAKSRDLEGTIDFDVEDATALTYADNSFEQVLYLQQIMSMVETPENRLKAARESYRILKPGGIGLFSFLCFDTRAARGLSGTHIKYLQLLRKLRGDDTSIQSIPWLKWGGKFNWRALFDRAPYLYLYKPTEVYELLTSVGYRVIGLGTDDQIARGQLATTDRELLEQSMSGVLYFVVTK